MATQSAEVLDSKGTLEHLLKRRVDTFAYPYGDFDGTTVGVVRDAGFAYAVTVEGRLVRQAADPMQLPRIEITNGNIATFAAHLAREFDT